MAAEAAFSPPNRDAGSTATGETVTVRCGELHCQKDSFARELRTTVLGCQKSTVKADIGKLWEVRFKDTVLFPEGGGQPCDTGVAGGIPVVRVVNEGGEAFHYLSGPLEVGAEVDIILDWERRQDLMHQHSAQHLITALSIELFGYETLSWDLGREVTTIDLSTEQLTAEEFARLEDRVNSAIVTGHAVSPRWISRDSEEMAQIRCRGLPENVTGPVRVLEIAGIDTNLCCGTHVQNTSQLRMVKLLRTDRVRDRGKTFARLHFVAGDRVLTLLGDAFGRQQMLNGLLSVAPDGHATRIEAMLKSEKETVREMKTLTAELTELQAERLKGMVASGKKVLELHRDLGDINFMRGLATALDDTGALLLTTAGGPKEGTFMLSGPADLVAKLGPKVAEAMDGKGGGGKGRYQGKVQNVAYRQCAVALMHEAVGLDMIEA